MSWWRSKPSSSPPEASEPPWSRPSPNGSTPLGSPSRPAKRPPEPSCSSPTSNSPTVQKLRPSGWRVQTFFTYSRGPGCAGACRPARACGPPPEPLLLQPPETVQPSSDTAVASRPPTTTDDLSAPASPTDYCSNTIATRRLPPGGVTAVTVRSGRAPEAIVPDVQQKPPRKHLMHAPDLLGSSN